jgi:hypothetical protein
MPSGKWQTTRDQGAEVRAREVVQYAEFTPRQYVCEHIKPEPSCPLSLVGSRLPRAVTSRPLPSAAALDCRRLTPDGREEHEPRPAHLADHSARDDGAGDHLRQPQQSGGRRGDGGVGVRGGGAAGASIVTDVERGAFDCLRRMLSSRGKLV